MESHTWRYRERVTIRLEFTRLSYCTCLQCDCTADMRPRRLAVSLARGEPGDWFVIGKWSEA